MSKELSKTRLRSLLVLRGENFYWKVDHRRLMMGDKAGSMRSDGVCQIQVDGKIYLKHRLIHFYNTGVWPDRAKPVRKESNDISTPAATKVD